MSVLNKKYYKFFQRVKTLPKDMTFSVCLLENLDEIT